MQEIWLPVEGYEGRYEVSNLGRIKSLARTVINTGRVLKEKYNCFHLKRGGYHSVLLSKDTVKSTIQLHRIVAKAFLPNPDNKRVVNHIDGDKLNNRADNLEWVSYRENSCHYYAKVTGGKPPGIYKRKNYESYSACITINNRHLHIGEFKTQEEAYQARINYEKENNIINKYL